MSGYMPLEQAAAEARRLAFILEQGGTLPRTNESGLLTLELKNSGWLADCGGEKGVGTSAEAAMGMLLKRLRTRLRELMGRRRKDLEDLLTLENEAAVRLLAEEDPLIVEEP